MQLFAHIGITLGSAWVLQKTNCLIKYSVLKPKPSYAAITSSNQIVETGASPAYTANWLDYRFLLLGSILPDIVDKPLGILFLGNGRTFCHTLFFTVIMFAAGLYFSRAKKNPALFCIALGCIAHLLLDSMGLNQDIFLWPLFGWSFPNSDFSIGPWLERTFSNLHTNPSYYLPETIGGIILILFCVDSVRNGRMSGLFKSRLAVIYHNVFGRNRRSYAYSARLSRSPGLVQKRVKEYDLISQRINN